MKVAIQTLGCKVNQSESASIEGLLRRDNHEIVTLTDNPDLCIVNTCTVTAKSDYQSRQLIRRAARAGAKVIATGCYAQLRSDELMKIEGLSRVVGNAGKNDLLQHIADISSMNGGNKAEVKSLVDQPDFHLSSQPYYSTRSRAFLKIQDGCNFACSYCTIPMARGRSRSLSHDDLLASVKDLYSDGYREIVLTGIHIGSYGLGIDIKSSLLSAVTKIVKNYPDLRIRLSSLEPQEVKDGFLALMDSGNICSHLHIPLQSGSDKILKLMNRGYNLAYYEQLINRIVTKKPNISIGTDVIVGFPGERDKDFDDTLNFISELPLSYLHVFPYSRRPDTLAASFKDQIDNKIKKDRVERILTIGKIRKNNYMKRFIGQEMDVIVQGKSIKDGCYNAISDNYIKISVQSDLLQVRSRLNVKVFALTDSKLVAQPLN